MLAANSELANATLDATNKDKTKQDEANPWPWRLLCDCKLAEQSVERKEGIER